jgi:Holliday junction resolvase
MSGRRSRNKGARRERGVTAALQDASFAAKKISGMYKTGPDITVALLGIDRDIEVKARAAGFKRLRDWLIDRYALVVIADREEPLVVLRLRDAIQIAKAAEGGR